MSCAWSRGWPVERQRGGNRSVQVTAYMPLQRMIQYS
jgi:hypothetical protein